MSRYMQWGVAIVAAAVVAASAPAQLVPKVEPPKVPLPVTLPPLLKPLPARPAVAPPAIPQVGKLPVVGTVTPPKPGALVGTVTSVKPGTLVPAGTVALPKTPLSSQVDALASRATLDLPPAGRSPFTLSGSGLLLDHSAATAAALRAARQRRLDELIRTESRVLEMDEQGNPVVRGKLLVLDVDAAVLRRLTARGFVVISNRVEPALGIRLTELGVPRGFSAAQALRRLRSIAPGAQADFDHVYQPAGGGLAPSKAPAARGRPKARLLIGMIDGGVAAHPSLSGVSVDQMGFAGPLKSTGHGTAVASLIAGRQGTFRGAAYGASLAVADVYGGSRAAGSASAIARAAGWLAAKRPTVVNISLVGPSNRLLAAAIKGLRARNIQIVAAVGNDGPASPPQYPASYAGVVAITGVDSRGRAIPEAGNAAHIDFAAPAAHMAAARPGAGYARVRGTSFAAPLAAGRLAMLGSMRKLSAEARPGVGRVGRGIVCAPCRIDPVKVRAD